MAKPPYEADYLLLTQSLRQARVDAGMDQAALASRLGVTQSFVSNYERGVKTLDVIEFVAICAALSVEASEQILLIKRRRTLRPRKTAART